MPRLRHGREKSFQREQSLLFLKKKKQKDFCFQASRFRTSGTWPDSGVTPRCRRVECLPQAGVEAFHCQRKTVHAHNRYHQTEAEAAAWNVTARIGPLQTVKHRLAFILRHARAAIRNPYQQAAVFLQERQTDRPRLRCKLDGNRLARVTRTAQQSFHARQKVHRARKAWSGSRRRRPSGRAPGHPPRSAPFASQAHAASAGEVVAR